jgi:hypothetical protein
MNLLLKIEKTIGDVKFAVIIIAAFAIVLGVGTFVESYNGVEYANRSIYKSLAFMALQFLMFLSIFYATVQRLPLKKRLYGFYVLHLGLLMIFAGAYVTYHAGVDGSLTLPPNTPARSVTIARDVVKIKYLDDGQEALYELPYTTEIEDINQSHNDIKIKRYLPFAEDETSWIKSATQVPHLTSSEFLIANPQFNQKFIMSLSEESEFASTTQLGPLNVHYMPPGLLPCFGENNQSKVIIWDMFLQKCFIPEKYNLKMKTTASGSRFLAITLDGKLLKFLPDMTPLAVDDQLKVIENSPYRVFSKNLFEKSPHLFLFTNGAAFFDKTTEKWDTKSFENKSIELPWMGFKISQIKTSYLEHPKKIPTSVKPIHENGQTVFGAKKALSVEVDGKNFWLTNEKPLGLLIEGKKVQIEMVQKEITLPYQLNLVKFKMDTDPGTNNPASYESFVSLFDGKETQNHHIFMNNPLKYSAFTFYQASYFKTDQGFGSILSVNYDPGRWLKYLGSLLLVLGSFWHFILRRIDWNKLRSRMQNQSKEI